MKFRALLALAALAGAVAAPAAGSTASARWFVTPGKNVSCELGLHRTSINPSTYVWCLAYHAGRPYRTAVAAQMNASAKLTLCHGLRCIGNSPNTTPTLKVGHSISLGPFRCMSLRRGVRCVVTKLGHGFRLTTRGVKRV